MFDEVVKYLLDLNFKSVHDNFSPDFMMVENGTESQRMSIIINNKSEHCDVISFSKSNKGEPPQLLETNMKQSLKFDEILNGDLEKIIMEHFL